MGGDELAVKVKTDVKNGRKLLIVKDSYGNAVPGYLFGSFEEIYVVDMRNFQCNLVDFIEDRGVTDVLFTMVTYSAVGGNADSLEVLRTQAKGEPIYDGESVFDLFLFYVRRDPGLLRLLFQVQAVLHWSVQLSTP